MDNPWEIVDTPPHRGEQAANAPKAGWVGVETMSRSARSRLPGWVWGPIGLVALIVAVGVLLRTYRISAPLLDQHLFRQTQTASTVWLFDRFGYDPLNYRVPMFGAGNWVLEFPTYQSIVYGLTLVTGFHEWTGRVVSILCFVAAAWLLYLLVHKWVGSTRAAVFAVVIFTFLPISVFYFRAFMIDPLAIALTLAALLAATHLFERWSWPIFGAYAAVLLLAALTKPTIVAALGIPLATLGLRTVLGASTPLAGRLSLVGTWTVTAIVLGLWTRHSDSVNVASNGMSFSEMRDWYFGSTVRPELWTTVGQRLLEQATILGLVVVALGLVAIPSVRTRYRPELIGLVASAPISLAIFANLNIVHDYYQLPYVVTLAVLGGLGADAIMRWVARAVDERAALQAGAGLAVVLVGLWTLSLFQGYFGPNAVQVAIDDAATELAQNTPDERIVVVSPGADYNDPILFYQARRVGWRVAAEDPAELERILGEHDDAEAVAVAAGPVTPEIQGIVDDAGLTRTYESESLVVFSPTDPEEQT